MLRKIPLWGWVLLAGFVLVGIVWQYPRLNWRLDIARAYLRGVFQPAGPPPTAVFTPAQQGSPTPSLTPSLTPSATLIGTPSPTPEPTATALPSAVALDIPVYEQQDWNNCGPAALSMALQYYGWQDDQYAIAQEIKPQRDDRNVNIEEMLFYTRNHAGWLKTTYRVGGTLDLLRLLLANGIPVITEETFAFEEAYWPNDDLWAGHYLLVSGYDDARRVFITQNSFEGANLEKDYAALDADWKAFNRVFFIIYRAEQSALVQELLGEDWDVESNRQRALERAHAETINNPQDVFAWFNLGSNQVYFEDYAAAAESYDRVRELGWPQRMLRYQFGPFLAYFHAGRTEELLALADYALERTPNSEEALLWQGWAFYRLGRVDEARTAFRKALEARPGYADAEYALNFVGN